MMQARETEMTTRAPSEEHTDRRPIARLRRVAAALARLEQPHPADSSWLVAAVGRYQAAQASGVVLDLGAAMGLGAPGRRSWWADERRNRRDELLRELRLRHLPTLSAGQAATVILRLAATVETGGLRAAEGDDQLQLVAEALSTGQPIPAARQLKRLLEVDMNEGS